MGVRELVGDSKRVPAREKVKNHCPRFFKKREQFMDSAEAINKRKRNALILQQHFRNTV